MNLFLDSFWRALAYCLRPRVIALSILPLLLLVGLSGALAFFFWEPAIQTVQAWLGELPMLQDMLHWAETLGGGQLRNVLAPLLVLMLTLPLIIILTLLLVAWFMTPAMVTLVSERRFPMLERRRGGTFWRGVLLGLGSSLLATAALLMSLPLWFIPPLVMVLPPLIWGWLAYRVMVYDVLAEHASTEERLEIMRRHRGWLLGIGVLTGYMGAAPGMVWAVGAMAVIMAPLLVPVAIWIYTFVFSFASLWFAHFALGALAALRAQAVPPTLPTPLPTPPASAPTSPAPHEPHDVPAQP